ncbi:MAG TPA: tyrosinase family protein [Allosphingosinicella sp.]|jgi:hypothetical protein
MLKFNKVAVCSIFAIAISIVPVQAAAQGSAQTVSAAAPLPVATPQAAAPRKSITQLSPGEVASLRKAYAQMRAWNNAPKDSNDYRRSLQYWANMHAYIGDPCAPASALKNPGMSGLSVQQASTPDQQATWCKCQHSKGGQENLQFLTWHRMYLYYFEQVLQAASGDSTLRLPFFDYETDSHLPRAYGEGNAATNSLFEANRFKGLNAGTVSLDPADVDTSDSMRQTTYAAFNGQLEQSPHGAVHCDIGVDSCPSGYMGYVPTAGNDPIFYSHHANIDRLYECWTQVDPRNRMPSDPNQLAATFSFPDGTGTIVTRQVKDMLTTAGLGYSYPAGGGCPANAKPVQAADSFTEAPAAAPAAAPRVVQSAPLLGPIRLNRGVTRRQVTIHPGIQEKLTQEGPGNPRSLLVIEDIRFDVPPRVHFRVYLEVRGRRELVGTVNFFGLTAHQGHGHDGGRFEFDATDALLALNLAPGTRPTVVIEPDTGIREHSLETAVARLSPKANVRFGQVRIDVVQ